MFLNESRFCFRCHLPNIFSPDPHRKGTWNACQTRQFTELITRDYARKSIKILIRDREQLMPDGHSSLPVELYRSENIVDNPFLPNKFVEASLSQQLAKLNLIKFEFAEELFTEEDEVNDDVM